jgi:hypothetical protein
MDLELANKLVVQYYNLYTANKLEESKAQKLRDFHNQVMQIQMAAMPPAPMPGADPSQPMATPNQQPQSDLLPIVPQ